MDFSFGRINDIILMILKIEVGLVILSDMCMFCCVNSESVRYFCIFFFIIDIVRYFRSTLFGVCWDFLLYLFIGVVVNSFCGVSEGEE